MYKLFKHTVYCHSVLIMPKRSEIFIGRVGQKNELSLLLVWNVNCETQMYLGNPIIYC